MSRMECGENADLLLEFVAGRLDAEAAARLERHMEVCPVCREFAGGRRAVWEALEAWEPAPVSADFDSRLYRRIDREGSWRGRILGWFRPAPVRRGLPIAAAVLVLVAGVVLVDRSTVVTPVPRKASVQVESLRPDQAETALEDMEMLQEINGLVQPASPASTL